jgi:ribosomal protein S18 acetylase RimI-like enzyme
VTRCEEWYAERHRPCIFRLTPLSDPDLDAYLDASGYSMLDRTAVLRRRLGPSDELPHSRVRATPLNAWLETFARMSGMDGGPPPGLALIVGIITAKRYLATLPARVGQDSAACGMAVMDGTLVGFFDLVTDPALRRQGYGIELVQGLLAWGVSEGATEAYLQVTHANDPARRLYERVGFAHAYDYWYRVKDTKRGRP